MRTNDDETYKVIFSDRRKVRITVERDGSVLVRAPRGTAVEDIERLLQEKKRWIGEKRSHPQKYELAPHPPGKELVSGESMLYLGHSYRVEIVEPPPDHIVLDHEFRVPRVPLERARDLFQRWYLERAMERLVPRALDWGGRLGVRIATVDIAEIRYRWGSCTPAGNVRLNWRLIKAPPAVADYVIVHEAAHLIEPSHSDRFWSIVRSQLSKVDKSREWLREQGHLLEQDL